MKLYSDDELTEMLAVAMERRAEEIAATAEANAARLERMLASMKPKHDEFANGYGNYKLWLEWRRLEGQKKRKAQRKQIQAKHISTEAFVAAVQQLQRNDGYANVQKVADVLGMPWKVTAAKLKRLDRQGVVSGCWCGCGSPIFIKRDPSCSQPDT